MSTSSKGSRPEEELEKGKDEIIQDIAMECQKKLHLQKLKKAISQWRRTVGQVELALTDDYNGSRLRIARDFMYSDMDDMERVLFQLEPFCPEGVPFDFDKIEEDHREMAKLIRLRLQGIISEGKAERKEEQDAASKIQKIMDHVTEGTQTQNVFLQSLANLSMDNKTSAVHVHSTPPATSQQTISKVTVTTGMNANLGFTSAQDPSHVTNYSNNPATYTVPQHPNSTFVSESNHHSYPLFYAHPQSNVQTLPPAPLSPAPSHASSQHSYQQSNHSEGADAMTAMARLLRKPQVEVKQFSGNPIEFNKFLRHFKASVAVFCESDEELMTFLEQYTAGEAHKIVRGFSHLPPNIGYRAAMVELQKRYGNVQIIANAYVEKVLGWQKINMSDVKSLDEFAMLLTECLHCIGEIQGLGVLEYSSNMKAIVQKLPYQLHEKWRGVVQRITDKEEQLRFDHLVDFVSLEARKGRDTTFGRNAMKQEVDSKKTPGKFTNGKKNNPTANSAVKSNWTENSTVNAPYKVACSYCPDSHYLSLCEKFNAQTLEDKYKHITEKELCYGCLKPRHWKKDCRGRLTCRRCNGKHPTTLHREDATIIQSTNAATDVVSAHSSNMGAGTCKLAIVPVKVKMEGKFKAVQTYAFLDPGSSACFCTDELLSQIGGSGKSLKLRLTTMGLPHVMDTKEVKGLQISGIAENDYVNLPVTYTKDKMPVDPEHIPLPDDLHQWPHMQDVNLPIIEGSIGLLIGNNVPEVYSPLEICTGPRGSPYASRTAIGWIPWSVVFRSDESTLTVNRAHVEAVEDYTKLNEMIQRSINHDFPELTINDKKEFSVEDNLFLGKVEDSIRLIEGHYYIDLPFRDDQVVMPNNYEYVRSRLRGLAKKLDKDEGFKKEYTKFMKTLLDKNYAEEVPKEAQGQQNGRQWYVPHHGVFHPTKKKLRVVFDCAAVYNGVSLNQQLLQSPNLANSLLGVLLKFREEQVAVMGDIEAMYHQVKVPYKDRDYLRFLWWPDGKTNQEPKEFRMGVHLFGATSSPACAISALHKTATAAIDKEIRSIILHNFYVDDCLVSVPTEQEAIDTVTKLKVACATGGFNVTKWVSNSEAVNRAIGSPEKNKLKQLDEKTNVTPVERALGVSWEVQSDSFCFNIAVKDRPPTRRNILSVTSSIYDPLGLASPCTLPAKLLLREMCGLQWDEVPAEHLVKAWNVWLSELPQMEQVKVTRAVKQKDHLALKVCELHHFCDASERGYGTASYIRSVTQDGKIRCALLLGKSRVAPLKKVTVPRLELTAARMAVQVNKTVCDVMKRIDKVHYWTDSTSVLKYIANKTSRFHTFVANRITVIQESSTVDQWHHVPSALNPADLASRGASPEQLVESIWFTGPEFLWHSQEWQSGEAIDTSLDSDDQEVKTKAHPVNSIIAQHMLDRFSNFTKCKSVIAWVLIYKQNLEKWVARRKTLVASMQIDFPDENKREREVQKRIRGEKLSSAATRALSADDYQAAEDTLVKITQEEGFKEDLERIRRGMPVSGSSPLRRLDPVLKDGKLLVGGRVRNAALSDERKHPLIIPKASSLAKMIVSTAHRALGHSGKGAILSHLQRKYWIIGANSLAKQVVSKCVTCRKYRATRMEQKMADLPKERLAFDAPPFTHTGCDYFGPLEIKRGRGTVKRYGVVFTCMTTRAVHLEVADDLSTSSCINAIRRFVARRGTITSMRSDNGTNLVGASRELRSAFKQLDQTATQQWCAQKGIKWSFNPPSGSHFGGVWERMIRSARRIMYGLVQEQSIRLDDEGLRTLLCEVETILNSRPLTKVSNDPEDLEALTPSHLLLFKGPDAHAPGLFNKDDTYARRRWRQIQYLADVFWSRWVKEYVPLLQERQKWLKQRRNVAEGDIVLLVDGTTRGSWVLGRIVTAIPDKHGVVRIVNVKTKTGTFQRPVHKLCMVLEGEEFARH